MEDKKISEAVELLFKGAKMLAYHCPECKMPLFKYKDKILCPSCKKEAVIVKEGEVETVIIKEDKKEEKEEKKDVIEREERRIKEVGVKEVKVDEEDVEVILKKGLIKVAKYLVDSKEIDEIQKIVVILEKLVNIIEKIKKIK